MRGAVCPSGVFVVFGAVAYAPVQEPDKSVGECAERLVVEVSGSTVLVVERASGRTLAEGAERPPVDGIVEPPVADMSSQYGPLLARRNCQG